jgi:hypothetical protein
VPACDLRTLSAFYQECKRLQDENWLIYSGMPGAWQLCRRCPETLAEMLGSAVPRCRAAAAAAQPPGLLARMPLLNRTGDFVTGRHCIEASHQKGPRTSGIPNRIRTVHPLESIVRWWYQQSSTPLSVWVGPPLACSMT